MNKALLSYSIVTGKKKASGRNKGGKEEKKERRKIVRKERSLNY